MQLSPNNRRVTDTAGAQAETPKPNVVAQEETKTGEADEVDDEANLLADLIGF